MKRIDAIFRTNKLESVISALQQLGVRGMTISNVHVIGSERGAQLTYRGVTMTPLKISRVRLEIIAADSDVDSIVAALVYAARTGNVGDGRIVVVPVEQVVQIRSGEIDDGRNSQVREAASTTAKASLGAVHTPSMPWFGARALRGSDAAATDYWATHSRS